MLIPRVYKLALKLNGKGKVIGKEVRVYLGDEVVETYDKPADFKEAIDPIGGERLPKSVKQEVKEIFRGRFDRIDFDENNEVILFTEEDVIREIMRKYNFINEPNRKR
jgi:hypothetical protein